VWITRLELGEGGVEEEMRRLLLRVRPRVVP